ncbi:autophagy-related protein 16 isoform X2 [Condylostylus longicornis]|uniref:autophagy-related protein 16 isoform X2 n=1 Tax=Condylostylus longicornis TaxID=2530218 RepID=UPI00244E5781|nr:autophagy-related protein 16 isoform X2 [Condylostylus longicornis]
MEWKRANISRLRERNKQSAAYKEIIGQNNRLLDSVSQLKNDYLKISVENEQLRMMPEGAAGSSSKTNLQIAALEKKLLNQQEELVELHRMNGKNAQRVDKQDRIIKEKEESLKEQTEKNNSLKAEVQMLKSSLEELKSLNAILRDEHTALQLAFSALEEKLRSTQNENRALVDRILKFKSKDAEELNRENESFLKFPSFFHRKRSDKVKRDLEDAVRETSRNNSISPVPTRSGSICGIGGGLGVGPRNFVIDGIGDSICDENISVGIPATMTGCYSDSIPTNILLEFDAHDGEINAVRWSPVGLILATGAADRKIKLWDVGKRMAESRGVLSGCNAAVNSIEFDSTGSIVLGASNDHATRLWTIQDQRVRTTLTGHSAKVMAAKFLQEPSKAITGSHDRTLKLWDLRTVACVETKFAGSSCNDLVTIDSLGSTIISGHFDKKLRFWDTRADHTANEIVMPARITSLDLSKDHKYLICGVRDDTIRILDLRTNQIIGSCSHDNFKMSCDWARVAYNCNSNRIAAGSSDGSIFVWNDKGDFEARLEGHIPRYRNFFFLSCAVNAVSWHSNSSVLATVGKGKKCIVWSDG